MMLLDILYPIYDSLKKKSLVRYHAFMEVRMANRSALQYIQSANVKNCMRFAFCYIRD
jgi:hypothetical protein